MLHKINVSFIFHMNRSLSVSEYLGLVHVAPHAQGSCQILQYTKKIMLHDVNDSFTFHMDRSLSYVRIFGAHSYCISYTGLVSNFAIHTKQHSFMFHTGRVFYFRKNAMSHNVHNTCNVHNMYEMRRNVCT